MNPPDLASRISELWDELPSATGTARGDLLMELGEHLLEADRHSEALPVLETAQELFEDAGIDLLAGRAAHNRGVILGHLGRPDEQLAAERNSIDLYELAQRRDLAGCSRMSLGIHLRDRGHVKEALPVFEAALEDFTAAGERFHRGSALMAILDAHVDLGRFSAATRFLRPTLAALAAHAPIPAVATLHGVAAAIHDARGKTEDALARIRQARAIWDALDDEEEVARCDIRSAVLSITTDGPEAAITTLQALRPERQEAGDVAGVAASDRGLGLAALARRHPHQALRRFDDAAAVFHACALFSDSAECDALAARALADLGRCDEARARLRAAVPVLERLHRPRAEAGARVLLSRLLLDAGDTKAALREAKRAESIARRGILATELQESRVLRSLAEQRLPRP
jgi:tetratricopeptide (TPR) repeat protein